MSGAESTDDAGFTLVELLVYTALMGIVFVLIGGFLINSLTVQGDVEEISSASNDGQLAVRSLETGIRNSSAFQVQETTSPAGYLLRARTAHEADDLSLDWRCTAWFYSPAEQRLYTTSSETGPVALPDSDDDLDGWMLLADEVTVPGAVGTPFQSLGAGRVAIAYDAVAGGSAVRIQTTIVSRQFSDTHRAQVPTTCS